MERLRKPVIPSRSHPKATLFMLHEDALSWCLTTYESMMKRLTVRIFAVSSKQQQSKTATRQHKQSQL